VSRRHILDRETIVRAPLPEVFAFFSRPENLARITPPDLGFRIVRGTNRTLRARDRIEYRIRVSGFPLAWITLITEWVENVRFSDLQEKGPYRYWLHTHVFESVAEGVRMRDRVEYELPFGLPGELLGAPFVLRSLNRIFDYRSRVSAEIFPDPGTVRAGSS